MGDRARLPPTRVPTLPPLVTFENELTTLLDGTPIIMMPSAVFVYHLPNPYQRARETV